MFLTVFSLTPRYSAAVEMLMSNRAGGTACRNVLLMGLCYYVFPRYLVHPLDLVACPSVCRVNLPDLAIRRGSAVLSKLAQQRRNLFVPTRADVLVTQRHGGGLMT